MSVYIPNRTVFTGFFIVFLKSLSKVSYFAYSCACALLFYISGLCMSVEEDRNFLYFSLILDSYQLLTLSGSLYSRFNNRVCTNIGIRKYKVILFE
jgi:hypothetical protein